MRPLRTTLDRLLGVSARDHRNGLIGFATLLLAMAAHAVLETARDTLFLSTLSPTRLPWAYLAIALLTLIGAKLQRRARFRVSRARALSLTFAIGSVLTAALSLFAWRFDSSTAVLVFYVWTGLLATVVVVQFWVLAGEVMDFGQAKRLFAVIGGGGLAGAWLGSILASAVLLVARAFWLPLVASALLALAAVVPLLFSPGRSQQESAPARAKLPAEQPLQRPRSDPYTRRVLLLALLATLTVTVADYVFKSTVAQEVPREQLGQFFGRYYAIVNGVAALVQLGLSPYLLRTLGVHRTVQVMPVMLLLTTLGFVAVAGFWSVLLLKASDGTLRHSVNRVSSEILYLPLPSEARERLRVISEAVGLRLGQALASIAVLLAIALGAETHTLGWALAGLASIWLIATIGLEPLYVARFRSELRRGTLKHTNVTELDVRSLETLEAALGSDADTEVITALDMFAAYSRTELIPALVLYHPSPKVVLAAIAVLSGTDRRDVRYAAARLLRHPDHQVRASALRMYMADAPDVAVLRERLRDESVAVRATALVGLMHMDALERDDAERQLAEILFGPSTEGRKALALALPQLPPERAAWVAGALVSSAEPELVPLLAHSIALGPSKALLPAAIRLLGEREARSDVRSALVRMGDDALDALGRALENPELPPSIRRHLPRTISRFANARAAAILERALIVERDEIVAHKILRGLGQMRADDPHIPADTVSLQRLAQRMVRRALATYALRSLVERRRAGVTNADTPGAELLSAALSDQTDRALERAFRMLHILEPHRDFEIVHRALKSRDIDVRARGRELAEHLVPPGLRRRILALVDERSDADRLRAALRFGLPSEVTQALALEAQLESAPPADRVWLERRLRAAVAGAIITLLDDDSHMLSAIAAHHLVEPAPLGAPREVANAP